MATDGRDSGTPEDGSETMTRTTRLTVVVALVVAMVGPVAPAWGHQTDEAEHHTEIRPESGEIEQLLSVSAQDLAHYMGHIGHHEEPTDELLDEIRDELREYFEDNTGVRADEELCELEDSKFVHYPGADGRVHYHQTWDCSAEPREVELANRIMLDDHDGYRHTAQIQVGDKIYRTVFDPQYPTYAVYPEPDADADPQKPDGETGDVDREDQDPEAREQPEERGVPGGGWWFVVIVAIIGLLAVVRWRIQTTS